MGTSLARTDFDPQNHHGLFLDATTDDNSVKIFNRLGWLPIDDINSY